MEKHRIKMEDLRKDNVFKVPERYFEELPSRIQERVTSPTRTETAWSAQPAVRWSLAAATVLFVTLYFGIFRTGQDSDTNNVESLLAQVNTADLILYLEESDITSDELIASVGIENIYFEDVTTEELLLENIEIDELESLDMMENLDLSEELL